ncbi:ABC transporter ATP-binding protein [Autumnicola psychrophila]|uniref:ABC transporter ATP-binding protein n=1 Tax=Autumnicola psychrophila TaxID=3075592 RepID=A0ABU3DS68_9FLAO|nr:ABC transporter ATP-binding protein [Zunongwangia sp. F225]MDT0686554.1 ABC transporter ATP-binding protein [Zunongwangia sp. F225]
MTGNSLVEYWPNYFRFFYKYLEYRIFIAITLSLLVGILDGIGIALFIPLFQLISEGGAENAMKDTSQHSDMVTTFFIDILEIQPTLLNIFLLIFIFFSLKGLAKFFETYMRILYQQYFMRKIRISNISLFSKFDFVNFLQADTGRIQNSFSAEIQRVNTAYKYYLKSIQTAALVLVYIIFAFSSDWKFTLLVLVGSFFLNFLFKFFYKRTKFYSRRYTQETHKFQNLLVQTVSLFHYLKATGLSGKYVGKLKENILKVELLQKRQGVVDSILAGLREPLIIFVIFLAIFINIYVFKETLGAILLSLLLLYRAITFFISMQEQWNSFLAVSGSLDNIALFTAELEEGQEKSGSVLFSRLQKDLKMQNLSFGFDQKELILKDIDLKIVKNETVAIVGESGAGKSTLMNILCGLLKPTNGVYNIDNIDITELHLESFKKRIGYIVQDAAIFNDSIYNNVTFWASKSEDNYYRFLKAIEQAAILDFTMALPQKEETILGSNGINISGGQKQRLAIARELYKEVDILFMDEATSALDGETEAVIQQNIQQLRGQYTIIIIAHRLSTVKNADKIVLMQNGGIIATGKFEELYKNSNVFQEMVELQNL